MNTPTRSDYSDIADLKTCLCQQFHSKDLGVLHYFLGIEVALHLS